MFLILPSLLWFILPFSLLIFCFQTDTIQTYPPSSSSSSLPQLSQSSCLGQPNPCWLVAEPGQRAVIGYSQTSLICKLRDRQTDTHRPAALLPRTNMWERRVKSVSHTNVSRLYGNTTTTTTTTPTPRSGSCYRSCGCSTSCVCVFWSAALG